MLIVTLTPTYFEYHLFRLSISLQFCNIDISWIRLKIDQSYLWS